MLEKFKYAVRTVRQLVDQLKKQTLMVYYIARDSRTPLPLRALALFVAAYVFSPIDLIPDFIPIIGYLDDLIIVPLGIAVVIRLAPSVVKESARARASQANSKPISYLAGGCVILLWCLLAWLLVRWLVGLF